MNKDDIDNLIKMYSKNFNDMDPNSIFNKKSDTKYMLYATVEYGKDYPSGYVDYDIFRILNRIDYGDNLNDIFSTINLESSFTNSMMQNILIDNNFIEATDSSDDINIKKEALKMNPSELSALLKKYDIVASGKKKKLVKLVIENVPEYEFGSGEFKVTLEGKEFLKDFEWISLYGGALLKFEFNDFYKYLDEHDGEFMDLALDFINEHFIMAVNKKDFKYYDDCYEAKTLVYAYDDYDLEKALKTSLERFIIRLNPSLPTYCEYYATYLIFNPDNIYHIKNLSEELNIHDVKSLFFEVWNSTNLEKEYITADNAFDYLKRALNDEDEDDLSDEFYNEYFNSPEELFKIGFFYYDESNYGLACDYFDMSLEAKPNQSEALFYQAISLCELKEVDVAMDVIDEALEINPEDARFWNVKAVCAAELNQNDEAIKYFEYSIELDPHDVSTLSDYAVFFAKNGDFTSAFEFFDKAFEVDKSDIAPLLYKSKIYIYLKDWENAEKCFEKAYEIDGDSEMYLSEKSKYYMIRKDYKKALECCNMGLEINEENYGAWMFKSMILSNMDEEEESKKCLEKAYRLNPDILFIQ